MSLNWCQSEEGAILKMGGALVNGFLTIHPHLYALNDDLFTRGYLSWFQTASSQHVAVAASLVVGVLQSRS